MAGKIFAMFNKRRRQRTTFLLRARPSRQQGEATDFEKVFSSPQAPPVAWERRGRDWDEKKQEGGEKWIKGGERSCE